MKGASLSREVMASLRRRVLGGSRALFINCRRESTASQGEETMGKLDMVVVGVQGASSPSSYQSGSVSSLIVAFEDPDRSTLRSLLQNRHLYISGMQAKVSRFVYP
jgi:hypothetical protein